MSRKRGKKKSFSQANRHGNFFHGLINWQNKHRKIVCTSTVLAVIAIITITIISLYQTCQNDQAGKDIASLISDTEEEIESPDAWNNDQTGKYIATLKNIIGDVELLRVITENTTSLKLKEPNDTNMFYKQGKEQLEVSNFDAAITAFKQAIEEQLSSPSAVSLDTARYYYNLGIVYYYAGQFGDAEEQYTNALDIINGIMEKEQLSEDPANSSREPLLQPDDIAYERGYVYFLRATAYLSHKDQGRAETDLQNCIEGAELSIFYTGDEQLYSTASTKNLEGRIYTFSAVREWSLLHGDEEMNLDYAFMYFTDALKEKGIIEVLERNIDKIDIQFGGLRDGDYAGKSYTATVMVGDGDIVVKGYDFGQYVARSKIEDVPDITVDYGLSYWRLRNIDEETAVILTNRAIVGMYELYLDEALKDSAAAIAIYEQLNESQQRNIADAIWCFAHINEYLAFHANGTLSQEDYEEYLELMCVCLKYNQYFYGEINFRTAISYEIVGVSYMCLNRMDKANENMDKAKEIFRVLGMLSDVEEQDSWSELFD